MQKKDGALNTASRLQKVKNGSTLHLRASYDLKTRNLKSAKIVFFVVNQLSVMAGDGALLTTVVCDFCSVRCSSQAKIVYKSSF